MTLDEYKVQRYEAINAKTQQLLEQGVSYLGRKFSIESDFLVIYLGMSQIDASQFPMTFADVYGDEYVFESKNDFMGLYGAAQSAVMAIRIGAVQLRKAVKIAETEAAIDAVQDNRVEQ